MDKVWFVYLLRCGDGSLYCGITDDVLRRLEAHAAGKGAKYTPGAGDHWNWSIGRNVRATPLP